MTDHTKTAGDDVDKETKDELFQAARENERERTKYGDKIGDSL